MKSVKKALIIPAIALIYSAAPPLLNGEINGNEIIWKTGKSKIRMTISADEIAELNIDNRGFSGSVPGKYAGSGLIYDSPAIRIWRVNSSSLQKSLTGGSVPSGLAGSHSIVLREASGRRRVLKGNVVVSMDRSMSSEDVRRWADGKGLVIIRQISDFSNSYLVKSPPGLASLKLAGKLGNDPSVKSSSPDWWSEITLK